MPLHQLRSVSAVASCRYGPSGRNCRPIIARAAAMASSVIRPWAGASFACAISVFGAFMTVLKFGLLGVLGQLNAECILLEKRLAVKEIRSFSLGLCGYRRPCSQ